MADKNDWTIAIGCRKAVVQMIVRLPIALGVCWGGFWALQKFVLWMEGQIGREITRIDQLLILAVAMVAGIAAGQILSRGFSVKVISDALNSEAPAQVRIEAAIAVVQMGPRGKGAVPALIAALDSSSVRRHAAYALGAIGPDASAAIGALTRISGRPGPIGAAARTAIERISR